MWDPSMIDSMDKEAEQELKNHYCLFVQEDTLKNRMIQMNHRLGSPKPLRNSSSKCSKCSLIDSLETYGWIWINNEWSTSTGKSVRPVSIKKKRRKIPNREYSDESYHRIHWLFETIRVNVFEYNHELMFVILYELNFSMQVQKQVLVLDLI